MPDIIATVRFLSTDEGGRKSATPSSRFGCIFTFKDKNFDCFLLLNDVGEVMPGDKIRVPIAFLYPELLKHELHVGDCFTLRELRIIAEGQVEEILS
jgi:hypothetical protein